MTLSEGGSMQALEAAAPGFRRGVKEYELVFVLRPDLDDAQTRAAIDRIQTRITERGGEVRSVEPWGRRRLAYPIRKFREGYYGLVRFTLSGQRVQDLKNVLGITEEILRFLIVAAVPTPTPSPAAPNPEDPPEAGEVGGV
jgi:small subunit ribosomal protein S6